MEDEEVDQPKRPRGRPLGSKNKAIPISMICPHGNPSALLVSQVMEVSSGADIVENIAAFSRRQQLVVCVFSALGFVTGVPFWRPSGDVPSDGRFMIQSLTGVFLPASGVTGLRAHLVGAKESVQVVGPLLASGTVTVIVATFSHSAFDRRPLEEEMSPPPSSPSPSSVSRNLNQFKAYLGAMEVIKKRK